MVGCACALNRTGLGLRMLRTLEEKDDFDVGWGCDVMWWMGREGGRG